MGLTNLIKDSQLYRAHVISKARGALEAYYKIPPPDPEQSIANSEFIALDLETTGLDAKHDEIVSIGWVLVRNLAVDFSSATHILVRPQKALSEESVLVHHIFDSHVEDAPDIGRALEILLPQLAGRTMIAHHAPIECGFLSQACKHYFNAPLLIPTVDTLILALRDIRRADQPIKSGILKLDHLRKSHNLPPFKVHNALSDAIAASGLFLAQMAKRGEKETIRLRDVLR